MGVDIVTEELDIREKASLLGFSIPDCLVLLPKNLDTASSPSDLAYESSTATIRKVLVQAGLEAKSLESISGETLPQSFEKSFDWLGPTIFVGAGLITQNPAVVTIALNMISAYLSDLFRGFPEGRNVKLTVIIERDGGKLSKRIEYSGPADGLKDLPQAIRATEND